MLEWDEELLMIMSRFNGGTRNIIDRPDAMWGRTD